MLGDVPALGNADQNHDEGGNLGGILQPQCGNQRGCAANPADAKPAAEVAAFALGDQGGEGADAKVKEGEGECGWDGREAGEEGGDLWHGGEVGWRGL